MTELDLSSINVKEASIDITGKITSKSFAADFAIKLVFDVGKDKEEK